MRFPTRFLPQTITAQITGLVVAAVLLGIGLTAAFLLFFFQGSEGATHPDAVATRIATITELARSAQSQTEVAHLLESARRSGIDVEQVDRAELAVPPASSPAEPLALRLLIDRLENSFGVVPLKGVSLRGGVANSIVVKLNDNTALIFHPSSKIVIPLVKMILVPSAFALTIVAVCVAFLSAYAIGWITSPLSSIAAAAHAFGRSSPDEQMLSDKGPREISQVARALNDMRTRIRALVDDRTRMLVAISHDLRTPLTRLRLRAERISDVAMRDSMLHDISRINDMLGETLIYLREGAHPEDVQGVDLPSLLQTICTEFTDVGHRVSYDGPRRFAYACRPSSLTRAVTNLVENGIKHGSVVTVELHVLNSSRIKIDVSDDGPGIPSSLREKVLEPFFKGDSARASAERSGFGLGLSIARDIVRGHGGDIDLLDHAPHGLTVRMSLSAESGDHVFVGQSTWPSGGPD
ncbi:MAG TPA: ATP-binding protein [Xanthobacteraceae bacterium]|nr:ATP-binding protein [Xanthobacteraceae bacterium]